MNQNKWIKFSQVFVMNCDWSWRDKRDVLPTKERRKRRKCPRIGWVRWWLFIKDSFYCNFDRDNLHLAISQFPLQLSVIRLGRYNKGALRIQYKVTPQCKRSHLHIYEWNGSGTLATNNWNISLKSQKLKQTSVQENNFQFLNESSFNPSSTSPRSNTNLHAQHSTAQPQ